MNINSVKGLLSKLIPNSNKLRVLACLPEIQQWRRSRIENYPTFDNRKDLYDFINQKCSGLTITYLEFGVFKGESIEYWSNLNKHKDSRFYGFDTFTGLPENWESFSGKIKKNAFDTNGNTPLINDSRVTFIKGLFQETLPDFMVNMSNDENLIIHVDADLYTSALYVLTKCDSLIKEGTIIIFDEFSSVLNEFRALNDYANSYKRNYQVLGVTNPFFEQVAIQITN